MKATAFQLIRAERAIPLPRRVEGEAQHIHDARCAAVRRLGTNWQAHPNYCFQPRHSNLPEVYEPARAAFLAAIGKTAAADRQRRKAFQQAERVRAAIAAQD